MTTWFKKKKQAQKELRNRAEGAKAYIEEQYVSPSSFVSLGQDACAEQECAAPVRSEPGAEGETPTSRLTEEYYQNVLKEVYGEVADGAAQAAGMPTRTAPEETPSFAETVTALMNAKGMDEKELCKAAHIDKAAFARMREEQGCAPSKDNVIAIAAALKLNPKGAAGLLESAGYSLSHADKRDLAVEYCFREGMYDVKSINTVLEKVGEKPLSRK